MNQVSSRSHVVYTLSIDQIEWREKTMVIGARKRSKIHFIDLVTTHSYLILGGI